MTTKNHDMPAFPGLKYSGIPNEGMTLRDYFAAKALPTAAANWGECGSLIGIAQEAYEIADAMLEARER
jgi:hypothetical protein